MKERDKDRGPKMVAQAAFVGGHSHKKRGEWVNRGTKMWTEVGAVDTFLRLTRQAPLKEVK